MIPNDKNMLNKSGASRTAVSPRVKKNQKRINSMNIPINPNSSPAIENIKIDTSEDSEELRTRKKTLYANFKSLIKEETLKNIVIPSQIKTNFKTGVEVSYWQNGKIRSYVIVKKSKSNIWDKSVRDALQSLGSYSSSIDNIILTNNIVFINFDIDPKTVYDFNASNR